MWRVRLGSERQRHGCATDRGGAMARVASSWQRIPALGGLRGGAALVVPLTVCTQEDELARRQVTHGIGGWSWDPFGHCQTRLVTFIAPRS